MNKLPIVILISGNGSNLQAIIDETKQNLKIEIRAVISNKTDAYGLTRAKEANIPGHAIPHNNYATRAEFEKALQEQIDFYEPKLVVLAGFMRSLEVDFVDHYRGRMINIHPSLLPKYPGLNTHKRVLMNGDTRHGCTIHFVTEEVDGGPIICQASFAVHPSDTVESLQERVHQLEHQLYPQVLAWFADKRMTLHDSAVAFDGQALPTHGMQIDYHSTN